MGVSTRRFRMLDSLHADYDVVCVRGCGGRVQYTVQDD